MRFLKFTSLLLFILGTFHIFASAQMDVTFTILRQEKIKPFYTHIGQVDRKIYFRITNYTDKAIKVYGKKYDEVLSPGAYSMYFDEGKEEWEYQTNSKKEPKFDDLASSIPDSIILKSKECLDFNVLFSSENDGGKLYRRVVYVITEDGAKPIAIVSDEFKIEE